MLIDSHCHLYLASWSKDLSNVIKRAKIDGVGKMICPGIDIKTSKKSITISDKYPEVFAATGVHPHDAKDVPNNYIDQLRDLLQHKKVIAVGEIGLDFYRNISDSEVQIDVFRKQLELAREFDLPVIIHNRNADEAVVNTLKEYKPVKGVAHCFSSDLKTANELLDLGLYISFAGNLTYKNSILSEVAKEIPLEKVLVETDSPYLTPVPFRGKENEPSHVHQVAEKLAEIKGIEFIAIADATRNNTERLFNI